MAEITLKGVTKRYPDGTEAVKAIDLDIADGEFMILVGPSGCGKSTALRMIAGLEDISDGELIIGGEVVNDLAPKDRDIAMVFQNYALYPHMTVRDNMGFALKLAKTDKAEIDQKVEEAARILDLEAHLERKPANLSGGQRQRVAMGRAIVRDPRAFLMDEPLSNLDAKLRVQMRTEVARIQQRVGTTTVYVTHDQTEAMTLGDRVAVMRAGKIQQVASPKVLYEDPANLFVAGFIGSPAMNFLPARIEGGNVKLPFGDAPLPAGLADKVGGGARDVIAGMRPEHFEDANVAAERGIQGMKFKAKVEVVESMGSELYAYFDVKGAAQSGELDDLAQDAGLSELPGQGGETTHVVARLDATSSAAAGKEIELVLDTNGIKLFNPDGGNNLADESPPRRAPRARTLGGRPASGPAAPAWWQRGAVYQVYPRSFADADGDGVGDLRGLAAHLDHLSDLRVEAVWLSPIFTSPMADYGYDVADYCDVDPLFGTLDGPRPARDVVPRARHPRRARLGAEPHVGPPPVVRGVALLARGPEARLVRVARRRAGGGPPNDWVVGVRGGRAGVDVRRGHGAVVPALVHGRAARPQLGQPRGRGGDARRAALLARPRHRRLPPRRDRQDRQGPAAALQRLGRAAPRRDLGQHPRPPARHPPGRRRVPRPHDRRRGRRLGPARARLVPQGRRPAAHGAQPPDQGAAMEPGGVRGVDRGLRGARRADRVAGVVLLQPRHAAGGEPLRRRRAGRRPGAGAAARCSTRCAARRSSTRARSWGCPTR